MFDASFMFYSALGAHYQFNKFGVVLVLYLGVYASNWFRNHSMGQS